MDTPAMAEADASALPATESVAVRSPNHDEVLVVSSPAAARSPLPAMSLPAVDEGEEREASAELPASVDLVEEKAPIPSPPVLESWRSLNEYASRDGDIVASALTGEPAGTGAVRDQLSEMRQLADQRLSELLAIQLASSSTLDQPAEWEALVPSAVAPVVAELADILQVGAPLLPEEPSSGIREPLADVVAALALAASLQKMFGTPRLRERIENTARACSWLTHVVDSLLAVVRVQDALLALPHAKSPASTLEFISGWESAQVHNLACRLEARETALREAIQRRRDAETSQQRAVAGEVEAVRQHEILLGLYDRLEARVKRANVDLMESEARREQLETRVHELEEELNAAARQVLPTLNADQAQHMYDFVWRHGCGQGDERAWAALVKACALDDPSKVPIDTSFLVMRAGRSARVVHAAPDREHLDVSDLPRAPTSAIKSSGSLIGAAAAANSTSLAPATGTSHESSLSTLARHSSAVVAASVRRSIQFPRDVVGDDDAEPPVDVGGDEWGDDDNAARIDERQVAKSAVRRRDSSSGSSAPAAARTNALPESAGSLRGVDATRPPVIDIEDSASDASSDGPRTPRGVKRRVASTVAANAMSAQRLARAYGTEGIDAFSPPTKRRSSPSSLSTPSSATPSDRSVRAATASARSGANAAARADVSSAGRTSGVVAARGENSQGDALAHSAALAPVDRATAMTIVSSQLGASPQDATGALPPLTFEDPEAAARIADYTAVPHAVGDDGPSGVRFARVDFPFALSSTRGRSSTVTYSSLADLHFRELLGISMQRSARGQSPYFPNYEPVRNQTELQLARLGPRGIGAMDDVLVTRPWDQMWRDRVKHVFLFDPNALSRVQVDWLFRVLEFMYRYRRQYWQRQHWYALSRQPSAGQEVVDAYGAREASNRDLVVAFNALIRAAPPGISTSLFWSEPAFWWVAAKPCAWPLADVATTPLMHQLAAIDLLEPVRCCWSNEPGRFVEALIAEQLAILDSHGGKCWQLPTPWCDPDFRPDT